MSGVAAGRQEFICEETGRFLENYFWSVAYSHYYVDPYCMKYQRMYNNPFEYNR